MSIPKVTIIVISYNEKEYLSRAIQSCLMQSYENIEIIIGDDGSDDGSLDMIKSYQNKCIKYFVMERNEERDNVIPSLRVSKLIKRAIDLTDGEYYIVLSGDDFYTYDQMISNAVTFLESHPKYSSYVYGFKKVSENKTLEIMSQKSWSPAVYYSGGYRHISCFVFRRIDSKELLDRFCDDTGLEFVLATRGKWKYNKTIAFSYFQRNASIMHKSDSIELAIIEIMVLQDIINWERNKTLLIKAAIYSRYYKPFKYLCENLDFSEKKYQKYFLNSSKYSNNIFDLMKKKHKILRVMKICHFFGRVARKICL